MKQKLIYDIDIRKYHNHARTILSYSEHDLDITNSYILMSYNQAVKALKVDIIKALLSKAAEAYYAYNYYQPIELLGIEYGCDDYALIRCNNQLSLLKIYNNTKHSYINFKGKRLSFNDFIKCQGLYKGAFSPVQPQTIKGV